MVQYETYSTIPQVVRELVANKVSLLDQYMLMQTGENEYTAQILNTSTNEVQEIRVYRENNFGAYVVEIVEGKWEWSLTNECYCYSNVGYGASLDLPVVEGVTAHASVILACSLMFAIVFKGVLFPCLLGRKRRGI